MQLGRAALALGGVIAVVLLVVVLAGALAAPSVGVVDQGDWGEVTENRTGIVTTIWVDNPNPLVAVLGSDLDVVYDLTLNEVALASGDRQDLSIERGNQTRSFTASLRNDRIQAWWVRYVRANETVQAQFSADVNARVGLSGASFGTTRSRTLFENETPLQDAMTEAVAQTEGTYPAAAPVYEVRDARARWGTVNRSTTEVLFEFTVHNPSRVPVPAPPEGIEATVVMNGVSLLATEGQPQSLRGIDRDDVIPPGETRTYTVVVLMDNDRVDDWFRRHVRQDERSDVEVRFRATVRNPLTGDVIGFPPGGVRYDCELQTAILVDDAETGTTCGSGGTVGADTGPDTTRTVTVTVGTTTDVVDDPVGDRRPSVAGDAGGAAGPGTWLPVGVAAVGSAALVRSRRAADDD